MWQISLLLVPIIVVITVPWIIYISITENGQLFKDKFICKCPTIFRCLSIVGLLIFSFILLMIYITDEIKQINFVYIMSFVMLILFMLLNYICFRYKIVFDINNSEIVVYRIFKIKKRFDFKNIYAIKTHNEKLGVYGLNNKKLFDVIIFLTGYPILKSCLRIIIENNVNHKPFEFEKLNEIMRRKYINQ